MITNRPQWGEVVDVVVVGTGAGAMTAATMAADGGSEVLVLEKDRVVGGTTGVSGGVMWIPNNHHMADAGVADSREEALAYLRRLSDGRGPDPALAEVFVDTAPEMLAYLEAKTPLQTQTVLNFPDYYFGFDIPGKKPGGRSVEPVPFPVRSELPGWADRVAARTTLLSLGAKTTLTEDLGGIADLEVVARRERDDVRVKGAAYIGALLKGLIDRGVTVSTESPAGELVVVDGAVLGLRYSSGGQGRLVGARRGVVLACGGFEWNREMVLAFLGYDVTPLSVGTNTGDGHVMAMEAGAKLGNMTSYWGQAAMFDPAVTRDGDVVGQMATAGIPGAIVVNPAGRRFMNEAVTYHDWPKAFGNFDANKPGLANEQPAWWIFDAGLRAMMPIMSVAPDAPTPDWIRSAPTIAALADAIGIDGAALEATVAEFNEHAERGEDPLFHRSGVRPLDKGPFFATEIRPATLGTSGGLRINADAQVLAYRGGVIDGLYAAGNTSASVFGPCYPSGGGPIAASATFGYIAGRHAAARPARSLA
jgi:succinate dehydrogenase/fumarate reductase flavoprotein subunit